MLGIARSGTTALCRQIGAHRDSLPQQAKRQFQMSYFVPRRNHQPARAKVDDYTRAGHAGEWSKAAAEDATKIFGDGSPDLHLYNSYVWHAGVGTLHARTRMLLRNALRDNAATVNNIHLAELVRAVDLKVCTEKHALACFALLALVAMQRCKVLTIQCVLACH